MNWNEPFVIRSGTHSKWNFEDLKDMHQGDVSIHVSDHHQLQFVNGRNYSFQIIDWSEFIDRVQQQDVNCYLRSIGLNPRKQPSQLDQSFPELAKNLEIPALFRDRMAGKEFSSVLRVSSKGLQMWTHFDVMDNLLMQMVGRKRVVLFAPSEAAQLQLSTQSNSSSSPILDIDQLDIDKLEFTLDQGDVLYIPALYFHNVTALDASVSVNMFWRRLAASEYDPKDLYGNKDLIKVQKAQKLVEQARQLLDEIDGDAQEYIKFYAERFCRIINSKE